MRYIVFMVLLLTVITGCGKSPQEGASPAQNQNNGQQIHVQQTLPAKLAIQDRRAVAAHLEQLAAGIPQVQGAKCVVLGNTAIVGINVDPMLQRARVDVIKYSVAEAFRKDPYGVHAFVTADLDLNGRIQEIRDDINNGRPIAGFVEELADIIGRIVPQIPRDITPQNNDPARADEDNQMKQNSL